MVFLDKNSLFILTQDKKNADTIGTGLITVSRRQAAKEKHASCSHPVAFSLRFFKSYRLIEPGVQTPSPPTIPMSTGVSAAAGSEESRYV